MINIPLKDVSPDRTTETVFENGIRYFKKTYNDLSQKQISDLFYKYENFHKNYYGYNATFPKALKTNGKSIYFEFLLLDESVRFRHMLVNYSAKEDIVDALHRIAKAFADIHKIFLISGHVHGDPWSGNIYLKKDSVVIIDADPPVITACPDKHICNVIEKDLADFLVCLNLDLPREQWWRHFRSYNSWHTEFLETYIKSGGEVNACELSKQITQTLVNRKKMVLFLQTSYPRWVVLSKHRARMTVFILLNKLIRRSFKNFYHIFTY